MICLERRHACFLILLVMTSIFGRVQSFAEDAAPQSAGKWRDTTVEQYVEHLEKLRNLTQACAKARDLKGCDPTLIGPDDRILIATGGQEERRLIRFGWLRVLFSRAEESDNAAKAPGHEELASGPSTSQLLAAADARLAADIAQATGPRPQLLPDDAQRAALRQVLAGREFRNLKRADTKDPWLERFGQWINHLFEGMGKLRNHSAWLGRALVWGFVLTVGVGLVWALLRMERRWRIRLVPEVGAAAPDAASARDWQLWMEDARDCAREERWREAIHFLYWAVISRLESKRLWPADRARTPREYLALLAPDDARKPKLRRITFLFERTWYGGRPVDGSDFWRAEEIASELIGGGPASPAQLGKTLPEGGLS